MAIETELVAGIELGDTKAIALLARGNSAASRAGFTSLCAHYALASTRHFSKHH